MDISELIKIRNFCKAVTVKKLVKDAGSPKIDDQGNYVYIQEAPAMVIMLDNEHSVEEEIHPAIWDDNNQLLYFYTTNVTTSMSLMAGTDAVQLPIILNIADYTEIQRIRVILNKDAFEKYSELLKDKTKYDAVMADKTLLSVQDQINDLKVKNIYNRFFGATNITENLINNRPPEQTDFSGTYEDKNNLFRK